MFVLGNEAFKLSDLPARRVFNIPQINEVRVSNWKFAFFAISICGWFEQLTMSMVSRVIENNRFM